MKSRLFGAVCAGFLSFGLVSTAAAIFIDTLGPQVAGIFVTADPGPDLFGPDGVQGPVASLTVTFQDRPLREVSSLISALAGMAPSNRHNYKVVRYNSKRCFLRDCRSRRVPISNVVVTNAPPVAGLPATATVELIFEHPLRAGFYEIKVLDYLSDPAGNNLDGENFGPYDQPQFPSGDDIPGREFIGQFKVRK